MIKITVDEFSVIPSILLSPFVLLLEPTIFIASVFLIVYVNFHNKVQLK